MKDEKIEEEEKGGGQGWYSVLHLGPGIEDWMTDFLEQDLKIRILHTFSAVKN